MKLTRTSKPIASMLRASSRSVSLLKNGMLFVPSGRGKSAIWKSYRPALRERRFQFTRFGLTEMLLHDLDKASLERLILPEHPRRI